MVVTLLVAWAAAIGPGDVLRGDGPTVQREEPTDEPTETVSPGANGEDMEEQEGPPALVDLMAALAFGLQLLLLTVFVCGVVLGARVVRESWGRRRDPRPPAPGQVAFDVLDAPDVLVRELAGGAAAQRELLRAGTPRNAIVEVWNRFETLASNVGATRRPWETSSEFTLRVLEAVDADSTAVTRLAALYREARFSDHELAEEHRAAALSALEVIHAGLTAPHPGAAR
jgi:hypothetical protein